MSDLGMAGKFKIVMAVWQSEEWVKRAINSVLTQTDGNYDLCVVVDLSTDDTAKIVEEMGNIHGFDYYINAQKTCTLANQINAIDRLDENNPDDVIVFVDGDDQLAHSKALQNLRQYYADGTKLTYGSYQSDPFSPTCAAARPYPDDVINTNGYRKYAADGKGICFNHLRTFKYELYYGLNERDLKQNGKWLETSPDTAMMIPCMELADGKLKFIPEVLYTYNSENDLSDWRRHPRQVDKDHDYILRRVPKKV